MGRWPRSISSRAGIRFKGMGLSVGWVVTTSFTSSYDHDPIPQRRPSLLVLGDASPQRLRAGLPPQADQAPPGAPSGKLPGHQTLGDEDHALDDRAAHESVFARRRGIERLGEGSGWIRTKCLRCVPGRSRTAPARSSAALDEVRSGDSVVYPAVPIKRTELQRST